jgi:hypothetical protein
MVLANVLSTRIEDNVVWKIVPTKCMLENYVFDMAVRSNANMKTVRHMQEGVATVYNMEVL